MLTNSCMSCGRRFDRKHWFIDETGTVQRSLELVNRIQRGVTMVRVRGRFGGIRVVGHEWSSCECEIIGRTIETHRTIPSQAGSKTYAVRVLTDNASFFRV